MAALIEWLKYAAECLKAISEGVRITCERWPSDLPNVSKDENKRGPK